MPPRSPVTTYLLCALGVLVGLAVLVWVDGSAKLLASAPLGWSVGVAIRTWWARHGWHPGIRIVEDRPVEDAPGEDPRVEAPPGTDASGHSSRG